MDVVKKDISTAIKDVLNGIIFALILVKGGNPVIFSEKIPAPQNIWEIIFSPFPFSWLLALVFLLLVINFRDFEFKKLKGLPFSFYLIFIWFIWQLISSIFTVDANLTLWTMLHFSACLACFLLGFFLYRDFLQTSSYFWTALCISFFWILYNGINQHFGGLEEIRKNFEQILAGLPPEQRLLLDTYEFRVKIMSNRIFSVFVYPNAFAGVLLLMTPVLSYSIFKYLQLRGFKIIGLVLMSVIVILSVCCLYWTGSKAGWLVFSVMLIFLVWKNLIISKKIKIIIGISVAAFLISILFIKHSEYFQRGAKSVGARFDYWSCALKIAVKHPILGTGPGTFSKPYREIKKPESEMAKLTHNDYLEQASDSGFIGFIAFTGFIISTLIFGYRNSLHDSMLFVLWLGFLGWSLHSFFEFHLYIPSIAWTTFLFAGIIHGNSADTAVRVTKSVR